MEFSNWRRRRAKFYYGLAGWLDYVKTPQRTYRMTDITANPPHVTSRYAGRVWLPCVASMRLLECSMQLDWDHWDHWATRHVYDDPACWDCGGQVYQPSDDAYVWKAGDSDDGA